MEINRCQVESQSAGTGKVYGSCHALTIISDNCLQEAYTNRETVQVGTKLDIVIFSSAFPSPIT